MLLKESFKKPNKLFNKSLQNLKNFVHGGYKKLSKSPPFNPFTCSRRINHRDHEFNDCHPDFLEEMESDLEQGTKKNVVLLKEPEKEGNESPVKIKEEERRITEESKIVATTQLAYLKSTLISVSSDCRNTDSSDRDAGSQREKSCLKSEIGGSYRLAQKMKEMEMMDVGNVDHVLDIEEVLHYYSRLKSPVYLEIVDKFFIDMNSETLHSRPIVSKTNTKRRLMPLKLYK